MRLFPRYRRGVSTVTRGGTPRHAGGEPVSANDLTILAADRGCAPMNIGAALVVEGGSAVAPGDVLALLRRRSEAVPRLRQRLHRPPLGGGRPAWVDDPDFDLDDHFAVRVLPEALGGAQRNAGATAGLGHAPPAPTDVDDAVLTALAELVCQALPRDRPLWRSCWITGLPSGDAALVVAVHHVMTDGQGGLALLAGLVDEPTTPASQGSPASRRGATASGDHREQVLDDRRTNTTSRTRWRTSLQGLRELGLVGSRPHLAPRTSLNRPTGPHRRLSAVAFPLARIIEAAHARSCTVNDLVLTAVGGALGQFLAARGEHPPSLTISIPVSARPSGPSSSLGNQTGVAPVVVPAFGDPEVRLAAVVAATRRLHHPGGRVPARRSSRPGAISHGRGASSGPLGVAFRALASVGAFQPFIDHQRLVNTFVTNVRGPADPFRLAGHPVSQVVPAAVTPGNVGVTFDVLSYAGGLLISVVSDPRLLPDPSELLTDLEAEMAWPAVR